MFSDRETSLDALGFEPYVESLCKVILSRGITPFTIGIYGKWGKGKTSLMRMIQEKLDKEKGIKTVWFNAWKFEREKDIWVALVEMLLNEIEVKDESRLEEVKGKIEKLRHAIEWSHLANFVTSVLLARPDFEMLSKSINLKEKIESIHVFEEEFESLVELSGVDLLVVFVDDLDRCKKDATLHILEVIKLLLYSKKCVYILGLDYGKICETVKKRFQENAAAEEYLDKIVQLPFFIPRTTPENMKKFLRFLLISRNMDNEEDLRNLSRRVYILEEEQFDSEVSEDNIFNMDKSQLREYRDIINQQEIIIRESDYNPRRIKRFLNTYFLRIHIAENLNFSLELESEYMIKFLFLEIYHRNFHKDLEEYPNLLKEIQSLFSKEEEERNRVLEKSDLLERHFKDKKLISFLQKMKFGNIDPKPYLLLAETGGLLVSRIEEMDLIKDLLSEDFFRSDNAKHIFSQLSKERKENIINLILNQDTYLDITGEMGYFSVEPLVNLLEKTEDGSLQKRIISALEKIGSPAIEPLVNLLEKTKDKSLQKRIISALEKIGSPAVEPLVNLLGKTEDESLQWSIISGFEKIGSPAIGPLLDLLEKTEEESLQGAIVLAIERFRDERAVEPLLNLLKRTEDKSLQWNIISGMGEIRDERALKPLLDLYGKTEDRSLRWRILSTLGKMGSPAIESLLDLYGKTEDKSLQRDIVSALEKIGSPAVEPLLDLLEKTEDKSLQRDIVSALEKIGSPAIEPLLDLLEKTEDKSLQRDVISGIGEIRDERAIEPLLDLLEKTEDRSLQGDIISALEKIRDERALKPLLDLYGKTEDRSLRWRILSTLGKMGSPAVEPLVNLLEKTEDGFLQRDIVSALEKIGSPAVGSLVSLLKRTEDKSLQWNIISGLSEIRDERAVEPLVNLLGKTEDESLQWSIISVLGKIRDERAVEPLLDLLEKTEDKSLQWNIISGLSEIRDERAVEPLVNLLGKTEDESLQWSIISGFEKMGFPAIEPLRLSHNSF